MITGTTNTDFCQCIETFQMYGGYHILLERIGTEWTAEEIYDFKNKYSDIEFAFFSPSTIESARYPIKDTFSETALIEKTYSPIGEWGPDLIYISDCSNNTNDLQTILNRFIFDDLFASYYSRILFETTLAGNILATQLQWMLKFKNNIQQVPSVTSTEIRKAMAMAITRNNK